MLLKVKTYGLLAGRPVAIIPFEVAKWLNVHVSERIRIQIYDKGKHRKEVIAIVDVERGIKNDEIILSEEIILNLGLKQGDIVEVLPAPMPSCIQNIIKKLEGKHLDYEGVFNIVEGIVKNELTEAEIAYFVSGMYTKGMTLDETFNLTKAMVKVGQKIKFNNKMVIDKHCIGGIAGNRTTPIVISIISAAIKKLGIDAVIPKTSSRAITSAAGTADVIETLTGVEFDTDRIKKIVKENNGCLVWGGSLGLSPADDKIIQVERLVSLDPKSQLLASIMSKKIAVSSTHVLIDIPYGNGAKVNKIEGKNLAEGFKKLAKKFNIKLRTVLTDGSQPIGNGIGPILEMKDVLSVLKQRKIRPIDLEEKSILLASKLIEMIMEEQKKEQKTLKSVKKSKKFLSQSPKEFAIKLIEDGSAFEQFRAIIISQGGRIDESKLEPGQFSFTIKSNSNGKIIHIDNKGINYVARMAGCPADKAAGLFLHKHKDDVVKKDDEIVTIYAETKEKLDYAITFFNKMNPVVIRRKS